MTNLDFALTADERDDLPRTLRREREARERDGWNQRLGDGGGGGGPSLSIDGYSDRPEAGYEAGDYMAMPAQVVSVKMPFIRLAAFFIKAVLAAIPALILLGAILWFMGHLLQTYYPELVKMQILIRFPSSS
jgi:hypothetical protein